MAARAFGDTPDTAQHWAVQVLRMGRGMPTAWERLDALITAAATEVRKSAGARAVAPPPPVRRTTIRRPDGL
ncbi:hypothetical protein [Streptomyces sp. NBC_00211]|uniref:hypothetical protein n=1 Tax=Streptomyces sp. NBC_00211 TaxID=2975683 RepID=UPI00324C1884